VKNVDYKFTWSAAWIQEYESPWGILEKFKYANAINGNTVLELIGNKNIAKLKNVANAGSRHRNLIYFNSIDPIKTENIFGINLFEYHANLIEKLVHIIPNIKHISSYFHENLTYCPICFSQGFHSILHQVRFFDRCAFHPEQKLSTRCPNCNSLMPEYLINKGDSEAYRCTCGYHFLSSNNIKKIFSSWKVEPRIKSGLIISWLNLPKHKVHRYYIIYPFDNYNKHFEIGRNDYLTLMPKLLVTAFNKDIFDKGIIKISSNEGIFKIKSDYQLLNKAYMDSFPYLFSIFRPKVKLNIDSIFFEVYKQTRITYKAICRYILQKIIKKHRNCVRIFNKAKQNGDVCPVALAFLQWRRECEGKNSISEIETHYKIGETFDFKCSKERYSIFPHGAFMTHLLELLNPINREQQFNMLNCNISSMNYIINKILSYLLIERFIKWLEVIQNPNKFNLGYPDDNIPLYIAKIPKNMSKKICFYFPAGRIYYMKNIIQDINHRMDCPFNKRTKYPPYKSPIRIALDKLSGQQ
jgi:hypothetical protein